MLYNLRSDISTITGRNIAHARRTGDERALLGADLHLGRFDLSLPTIKQCARLMGVKPHRVAAAVAIAGDPTAREMVLAGRLSLLEAAAKRESLAEHLARASRDEMLEAARTIGPEALWDCMVAPLL